MVSKSETVDVSGLGLKLRATGKDVKAPTLLILLVLGLTYAGWKHHDATESNYRLMLEQMAEMTYVLSLPQAERDKLNLAMPESLRRRMRPLHGS
jgi:hypothetical protein